MEVNWNREIFHIINVENAVEKFYAILFDIIDKSVPKYVKRNFSGPPWFNKELAVLRNARNRAHNLFKKTNDPLDYNKFSDIRKNFDALNEFCYKRYITDIQEELKVNPKKLFNFVNRKRKSIGFPASMYYKGSYITDHCEISNAFKETFRENFTEDHNSSIDYSKLSNIKYDTTDICLPEFSEEDIFIALGNIKLSFVPGPDGIPSVVLKKCADALVNVLLFLFNLSLRFSTCPSRWKSSFILPVFKKGNKSYIEDYRGVTIQSVFFKLMDSMVTEYIRNHSSRIINDCQHGFVPRRSTCTNLIEFTSYLINNIEKGYQIDAIYTDFTKAFDRVNIRILCYKLIKIGFHPKFVDWIFSCLSNRVQYVKFCDSESDKFIVNSGIQQGSHSGPLYFILFINDIYSIFESDTLILLFADDAKLARVIKEENDNQILQADLDRFSLWCEINKLPINGSKCNKITFHRKRKPLLNSYYINMEIVKELSEVTDLGIVLDQRLTFNRHIDICISKCNKMLGFIKRNSKDFSINTRRLLYCALVRPRLEYCSVIWNPYYEVNIKRIEDIQARFTRSALFNELPISRNDRNIRMGLNSLKDRRDAHSALMVYDILNNRIDSESILSKISFNAPRRGLRDFRLLRIPHHSTNYGQHEPITNICRIFNQFYDDFDFNINRDHFKNLIYGRFNNPQ